MFRHARLTAVAATLVCAAGAATLYAERLLEILDV